MPTGEICAEIVSLEVSDGTTMAAYTARPTEESRHPSLLILQEAFGVNAHIRDMTERYARDGFVCIAPELFHRTAPGFEGSYRDFTAVMPHYQAMTDEGLIADLRASFDWLNQVHRLRRGMHAATTTAVGPESAAWSSFRAGPEEKPARGSLPSEPR